MEEIIDWKSPHGWPLVTAIRSFWYATSFSDFTFLDCILRSPFILSLVRRFLEVGIERQFAFLHFFCFEAANAFNHELSRATKIKTEIFGQFLASVCRK